MTDMFVGRLMSSPVRTVTSETTLSEAATKMYDAGIGSVVVVDGENALEGILTATDFVRLSAEGRFAEETAVGEYMSTDVTTTTANTDLRDVADTMIEHGFHHLPVVDESEGVVGIVTTTDLTAYLSHVEAPSPE
jgi:CBS domain-containing protein